MKSPCCKHEIVIQTDPKNTEYVIISGAQKKTEDFDVEDAETLLLPADEGSTSVKIYYVYSLISLIFKFLMFCYGSFLRSRQASGSYVLA